MSRGPRHVYAFRGLLGCVTQVTSRVTGTKVGVYAAAQAGIESDPDSPWASVCEPHDTCVTHATLEAAKYSTNPLNWCDDCRDERDNRRVLERRASQEKRYGEGP